MSIDCVDAFPWLRSIPAEHRHEFATELLSALQACGDLDAWTPLPRLVREWRATAEVYANPELAAKLKGPFDDDSGPVVAPEVATDDAEVA